jgi:hypothetical protein
VTRVEVDQYAIDIGNRAKAMRLSTQCNCPVAHALAEAGFDNPDVRFNNFTAGPAMAAAVQRRKRYALPLVAQRFIVDFDDNRPVEPFAFDVDETDYAEVLR